jgi:hypothetical protein
MHKMIVKMFLLASVARCAGILMIRIGRVRALIAIIGMQVVGVCSHVTAVYYIVMLIAVR